MRSPIKDISLVANEDLNQDDATILTILQQGIPREYIPRTKVIAAAVGISDLRIEGTIIRRFHNLQYGTPEKDVLVAGCDKFPRICFPDEASRSSKGDYFLECRGERGDAASEYFWRNAPIWLHEPNGLFDFVFICYPDYNPKNDWREVFRNAIRYLTPHGVAVTISHLKEDIAAQREMCQDLAEFARIQPEQRFRLPQLPIAYSFRAIMPDKQKTLF